MDIRKFKWFKHFSLSLNIGTMRAFGFGFKVASGDGDEITLGLYLWYGFYFSIASKHLYKLFAKFPTLANSQDYMGGWGHVIDFIWYPIDGTISAKLWDYGINAKDRSWYLDLKDFFLGRAKYRQHVIKVGYLEIPMPEGDYAAMYQLFTSYWKRPRWPWEKAVERIEVNLKKPIPIPGKGENAWDIDDDGIYSTTLPVHGRGLNTIANDLALRALKDRVKYGGSVGWRPRLGFRGVKKINQTPNTVDLLIHKAPSANALPKKANWDLSEISDVDSDW